MKRLSFAFGASFALLLSACDTACHVDGKMSDMEGQTEVYVLRKTGEFTCDTIMQAPVNDGTFQFVLSGELLGEMYSLKFGDRRMSVSFFAESGNVNIEGNGKTIYDANVTGTPDNEIWMRYQDFMREMGKKQQELQSRLRNSDEPDSIKRQKFGELFQESNRLRDLYKDSLAKSHPASVAALYLAYQSLPLLKHDRIDATLAQFPTLSANRYYTEMKARADVLRKIAPGAIAPDFEVKTVDDGTVKLSSFRGKYLILDFWASWCAPCRQETVFIKDLYNKYHEKGLDVFSVSLDDDKEAWVKALNEDGMVWNHGCQLMRGGKFTPVAQLYGIDGIPAIWVIDPEGKILAEGLKGEELVDFCVKLFDNQEK